MFRLLRSAANIDIYFSHCTMYFLAVICIFSHYFSIVLFTPPLHHFILSLFSHCICIPTLYFPHLTLNFSCHTLYFPTVLCTFPLYFVLSHCTLYFPTVPCICIFPLFSHCICTFPTFPRHTLLYFVLSPLCITPHCTLYLHFPTIFPLYLYLLYFSRHTLLYFVLSPLCITRSHCILYFTPDSCFFSLCRDQLDVLFPLFLANLEDSIPSVRQGAAVALAQVCTAYGEDYTVSRGKFLWGKNSVVSPKYRYEPYKFACFMYYFSKPRKP